MITTPSRRVVSVRSKHKVPHLVQGEEQGSQEGEEGGAGEEGGGGGPKEEEKGGGAQGLPPLAPARLQGSVSVSGGEKALGSTCAREGFSSARVFVHSSPL